ncbi:MAG: neutral zinc metallopeptidase [Betaproteobacteria bacterium]|nr:neutral zinc metallopeptidase [Betaproteobacteria bacterium]
MRLGGNRESDNVEDRRGAGSGGGMPIGGKSIGIGTIILALVAMYFGVDPSLVLNMAGGPEQASVAEPAGPAQRPPADDTAAQFVSRVLADTEDTWKALFAQGGQRYQEPKLVLYSGMTSTACGMGQAAMGPFYCPPDKKVYIDLEFYRDLQSRFRAPGDFAQAYVIAHEVGHHVQHLLGISDDVDRRRSRVSRAEGNQLSVRLELQADCLAGVWAHHAQRSRNILESGDIEEGLNAASAIGDDRLQRQTQGQVVPESFTHGSSAQRVRWFRQGMESGDLRQCDTFKARQL